MMSNIWQHIKYYVLLGVLALMSGLLVALKLKDNEIHELQVENMKDRFKAEREEANRKVKEAKEAYEKANS